MYNVSKKIHTLCHRSKSMRKAMSMYLAFTVMRKMGNLDNIRPTVKLRQ